MNFKKNLECERLVESTSRKMNTVRPFFARSLFFTNKNQVFLWCLLMKKTRLMTANESSIERKEHYTVYYQIDSMLPPNHRRKLMQSYFVKQ